MTTPYYFTSITQSTSFSYLSHQVAESAYNITSVSTLCNQSNAQLNNNCSHSNDFSPGLEKAQPSYGLAITIVLAILAGITSLCTAFGNVLVVVSFGLERNLRQPSNYLIASLAVTDILIGMFSMPLYTLYLLENYWPLGRVLCDLWLSLDYTVCLVSQYTVFLITLDRFCSVKVPAKYRNWRTKRKIKVAIAVTWLLPTTIFFTSIIGWHQLVKGASAPKEGVCAAQFQDNRLFTAILVISYYWVTLVVMIGLYIAIYKVALSLHIKANAKKKRIHQITNSSHNCNQVNSSKKSLSTKQNGLANSLSVSLSNQTNDGSRNASPKSRQFPYCSKTKENFAEDSDFSNDHSSDSVPLQAQSKIERDSANATDSGQNFESPLWKPRSSIPTSSIHWDAFSDSTYSTLHCDEEIQSLNENTTNEETLSDAYQNQDLNTADNKISQSQPRFQFISQLISSINQLKSKSFFPKKENLSANKQKSKSANRARKALRTITFILGAFVLCWTPYHVVVLIDAFCTDACVNERFSQFTYWLCYMNSPLNPFCYAFANKQFKRAFMKIFRRQYTKNACCKN